MSIQTVNDLLGALREKGLLPPALLAELAADLSMPFPQPVEVLDVAKELVGRGWPAPVPGRLADAEAALAPADRPAAGRNAAPQRAASSQRCRAADAGQGSPGPLSDPGRGGRRIGNGLVGY